MRQDYIKIKVEDIEYTDNEIKDMSSDEVKVLMANCDSMDTIFDIALAHEEDSTFNYVVSIQASSNF